MKVLILPNNVASIASVTVEALNKINGIEARGFFIGKHKYHYQGDQSEFFEGISRLKKPVKWVKQEIKRYMLFQESLKWADIIHWVYDDIGLKNIEKKKAKIINKPSVIEWVGSDIRNPDILFNLNPYYKNVFHNGYEYSNYESESRSLINQQKFKNYGSLPFVNPEMDLYINKALFPQRYFVSQRLFLEYYISSPPSKSKKRPLIIHSPSAKIAKGTNYIIPVIEELQKVYDFDFKLIHNMPRHEVMELMKDCDLFIDQLIIGMFGLASCEAMAFGKPVLCFIMPEVFNNGLSEDCPIINTTIDTLKENLIKLITSSELRNNVGQASRNYAEQNFDAIMNANKMVDYYTDVIKKYNKR